MRKNAILVIFLAACPALYAGAISNTSLSLGSFSITSSDINGTVQTSFFSPAIFGDVYDSLGDYNYALDGPPDDPASGSANIPLAYANDSASGSGGLALSAASGAHVFGIAAQAGTDSGNNANVSGTFEIVDTTDSGQNPVQVTLAAVLNAGQSLFTATNGVSVGQSAFSEVTFALDLSASDQSFYDTNFLYLDNAQTIGPDSSYSSTATYSSINTPDLSQSIGLDTNTIYDLYMEADAESSAYNSIAPEPASLILMAAGLAGSPPSGFAAVKSISNLVLQAFFV